MGPREKERLLARESLYRVHINTDIKNAVQTVEFQAQKPKDKPISHDILGKPLDSVDIC